MKNLADVTARPFFIIFERSWQLGKVPEDRKNVNVMPEFKGKKEDWETMGWSAQPGTGKGGAVNILGYNC